MNAPSASRFFFATFVALGVVAGCSSSDEPAATPASDAADIPTDAGATGVFIDRSTACARYVAALDAKAEALGCTLAPDPACPASFDDLEQRGGLGGKCVKYDEGSIAACEARIASYTTCEDFPNKPCLFAVQQDPSGASCPSADAGADAPSDAPSDETDAAEDTAVVDAAGDSATEAAVDAAGDSADEAG